MATDTTQVAIAQAANNLSGFADADIFLFNGSIDRANFKKLLEAIRESKSRKNCVLILVSHGGDPDAGFLIARGLQDKYESFTILVSGPCKSAGTLVAVGAHQLVFGECGELGPIDIQMYKADNLAERQSGLAIAEALDTLIVKAIQSHGRTFAAILNDTNAIVSFHSAAKVSSDLIVGLFSPIMGRIDPIDVGEKGRAMRIALDYGKRLASRSGNLKANALEKLTRTYPSHSFVIDAAEARILFRNLRNMNELEKKLIDALGEKAFTELPIAAVEILSGKQQNELEATHDDESAPGSDRKSVGGDPRGTTPQSAPSDDGAPRAKRGKNTRGSKQRRRRPKRQDHRASA